MSCFLFLIAYSFWLSALCRSSHMRWISAREANMTGLIYSAKKFIGMSVIWISSVIKAVGNSVISHYPAWLQTIGEKV